MSCNDCKFYLFSDSYIELSKKGQSDILFIYDVPSLIDRLSTIPLCGLQELRESKCHTCKQFNRCFGYFFSGKQSSDFSMVCTGYEESSDVPFVRMSYDQDKFHTGGQMIDRYLYQLGIPRSEIAITPSVKCFPPGGRAPSTDEITCCRLRLLEDIFNVNPKVIITLGEMSLFATIGYMDEDYKDIIQNDCIIYPTYSPDSVVLLERMKTKMHNAKNFYMSNRFLSIMQLRTRHIKQTIKKAWDYVHT